MIFLLQITKKHVIHVNTSLSGTSRENSCISAGFQRSKKQEIQCSRAGEHGHLSSGRKWLPFCSILTLTRFDNDHLHWGGRSLLCLLIRMWIYSTNIHMNKSRNNFSPDIWATLSLVKSTHKIYHRVHLQYNFWKIGIKNYKKL